MALKFLNKKGWHTGSLRNIENVWKAEQKHEAEEKKLEELRRQIHEERERNEFRQLQEQAGLIPRQERLEFLYDSGLAVGRSDGGGTGTGSASGSGVAFKALEATTSADAAVAPSSSASQQQPGALFEDKPSSANDTWRKLHSDPLFLIRQREQEALARIKNNPVQMAMIRKSVEEKKQKKETSHDKKERKRKHRDRKKHSLSEYSDSEDDCAETERRSKSQKHKSRNDKDHHKRRERSDDESTRVQSRKNHHKDSRNRDFSSTGISNSKASKIDDKHVRDKSVRDRSFRHQTDRDVVKQERGSVREERHESHLNRWDAASKLTEEERAAKLREMQMDGELHDKYVKDKSERDRSFRHQTDRDAVKQERGSVREERRESHLKRRAAAPKLTEEERAAKLREMQMDAELHEEQRWKRLKKAEEDDKREVARASGTGGRHFLDAAQKSVFGAEKGGSSTIEESVRRRTYYSQRGGEAGEGNAFRR